MKFPEEFQLSAHKTSLPSWERGLKWLNPLDVRFAVNVAPLVGAWVEIRDTGIWPSFLYRRSRRGSVG